MSLQKKIVSLNENKTTFMALLKDPDVVSLIKKTVGQKPIQKYEPNRQFTVSEIEKVFNIARDEMYLLIHNKDKGLEPSIEYSIPPGSKVRPTFKIRYKNIVDYLDARERMIDQLSSKSKQLNK